MTDSLDLQRQKFYTRWLLRFLRFFFRLLYGELAWTYDMVAAVVSRGRWSDWIYTTLPYLEGGSRVLELGHGTGRLILACARRGVPVFGLDASQSMGRLAYKRAARGGYHPWLICGYAQAIPFPDSTFDRIAATFPTEYFVDPLTLAEIWRVLSPEGRLIVLPSAWIEGKSIPDRFLAWLFRTTGQAPDPGEKSLDPEWLRKLEAVGFIVRSQTVELLASRVLVIEATKSR
jgi:ubiquinone/menaquinone biosynthesis C-methylase UbiE